MATLTSRTTISNGVIHAWVDSDGTPWVEQPFNPIEGNPNWESEAEALSWANNFISTLQESTND